LSNILTFLPDYRHLRDRNDQQFLTKRAEMTEKDGISNSNPKVKPVGNPPFLHFLLVSPLSVKNVPFAPLRPQSLGESVGYRARRNVSFPLISALFFTFTTQSGLSAGFSSQPDSSNSPKERERTLRNIPHFLLKEWRRLCLSPIV